MPASASTSGTTWTSEKPAAAKERRHATGVQKAVIRAKDGVVATFVKLSRKSKTNSTCVGRSWIDRPEALRDDDGASRLQGAFASRRTKPRSRATWKQFTE